jgi:CRISPR-associated protein Cas2
VVTLFVYDISNDRIRTKVSEICLDYGLKRIQNSAFLGDISVNRQEELWLKCRRRLGKAAGNLQLFCLTPQDLARSRKYVQQSAGGEPLTEATQEGLQLV